MSVLSGLKPDKVFYYFEEISKIPHISFHEKEISDYCVEFAKAHGLEYYRDEMYNVVIVKEATEGYENVEPIIIQGHLDMVGDKTVDCELDLETEAIRLMVEGDFITADRTTLGADDGIAVAYALALLDDETLEHPRMEMILTVSEEVGLLGATAVDLSMCRGRRLINIDSEEEGIITAGCAGGVRALCEFPILRQHETGERCELYLGGLLGGHSGIAIGEGRANANLLMGRFLLMLSGRVPFALQGMSGGAKDNVIAKDATAQIVISPDTFAEVLNCVEEFNASMKVEYGVTDPDICMKIKEEEQGVFFVLDKLSQEKVLTVLNLMPNGIQTMSADIPGLVETSLNMGVAVIDEEKLSLDIAMRSSVPSAKEYLATRVQQFVAQLGGRTQLHGDYPAWSYARHSDFREMCIRIYSEMYGEEPKVEIIHAGLECGILSNKLEGLDCISIGPNMYDVHTPYERLSISSVARMWDYLKRVIEQK